MTLLEEAAARIGEVVTEERVVEGLGRAAGLVADARTSERIDADEEADILEGLELLGEHRGAIVGLTTSGATAVLSCLATGETVADLVEAASTLSFDETRSAMHRGTDATLDAGDAIKKRQEDAEKLAKAAGRFLLTKALPWILAAL